MKEKQKLISCKKCGHPLCKVVDWQYGIITIVCPKCKAENQIINSVIVVALEK
ncbi:MAG: hypothetical protein WC926_05230 [Candidatus Paceibacterota bacterium]|jgi:phage FluMu protein Com